MQDMQGYKSDQMSVKVEELEINLAALNNAYL